MEAREAARLGFLKEKAVICSGSSPEGHKGQGKGSGERMQAPDVSFNQTSVQIILLGARLPVCQEASVPNPATVSHGTATRFW